MQSPVADAFAAFLRTDPAAPVAWTAAAVRSRADLAALADRIGKDLVTVPNGVRIGISVRDGFVFLAAVLAIWRHGSCALLLDAADPLAPRFDLGLRFGAAGLVVGEPELRCVPLAGREPAADLAAIKLTSGSTDQPRGIGVTAAELIADCDALQQTMGIRADDRICAAVPLSFSYGIGSLLLPALWRGRVLVLPECRHPLGLLQALERGGPTVLPAVPTLLRALLQARCALGKDLRLCISAGAMLPPDVATAFRVRFHRPVHAFYGATEAGGICFDRTGTSAENGRVGTPVDGVQVRLSGENRVIVQSAAVGRALAPDPALRDGVFVTQDLGAWCDGELSLLGRTSDVFDVGGHKVHPREVERVIASLAGVTDAVVVPWRDPAGRAVCAALVVAQGIDEALVRRHCVQRLPAAKVPRAIVLLRELPITSRGKLARAEVERLLSAANKDDPSGCTA